jgi:diadenosine tetraphosphatase ApaH/serine/threonine PP2A family protein phosphatase
VAVLSEMAGRNTGFPEHIREIVLWDSRQLADHEQLLAGWPKTLRLDVRGIGDVLFCHATPRDENEIFLRTTSEDVLLPIFEPLDVPLVVCGHTHMQFDRTVGATRVVNAGSIGMPFAAPGAYWLLLGPAVQLRRTGYDLDAAAERLRRSEFPGVAQLVERQVLHPPAEEQMLAAYASVDGRSQRTS